MSLTTGDIAVLQAWRDLKDAQDLRNYTAGQATDHQPAEGTSGLVWRAEEALEQALSAMVAKRKRSI